MRYFNSILMISAMLLSFSCKKDAVEPETPKPQAPVVESASLRGPEGETAVEAGTPVTFTANVSVSDSELGTWTLEVRQGTELVASASGELSGTSAAIEKELELAVNPVTIMEDFYPAVTLKVTNTDEMYAEKTLTQEENVKITVPVLPDKLYLVDNAGQTYEMAATSERGKYRTSGDMSGIGTSFSVASAVTGGSIDHSGDVWEDLDTPTSEYGLKWIGFDVFTGEVCKMINHTVTMDLNGMAPDEPYKVYWSFALVQDCEVVFSNYPDGMQLQGDRFADVEGNTARYTGHTKNNFEVYYLPDVNWLVVKYQYTDLDSMWLSGENGSLPMSPYDAHPLNWFAITCNADNSTTGMSLIRESENEWRLLIYLKENFGIKLFSATTPNAWANEVNPWTSLTPETLVISPMVQDPDTGKPDGNYGNAGPSFTEGLYMLRFNESTSKASLERYTGAIPAISVE